MRGDLPKGVHRVRRKLNDGDRWYFYKWRGGPRFWCDSSRNPTDPALLRAYSETSTQLRERDEYMTPAMVRDFLSSSSMPKGERSRKDIQKWGLRFADHFKDAPAIIFEERGSRGEVNAWRALWKHSPKQHDSAGVHAVRILNWAASEGKINEHHCHKLSRLYEVDRSEFVWSLADREVFNAIAPNWVRRILCVACETGLRPADFIKLTTSHVEETPIGRRLRVKTNKSGRFAHIPVTSALSAVSTVRQRINF